MKKIILMLYLSVFMMTLNDKEVYAATLDADEECEEVTYTFDVVAWDTVMLNPSGHGSGKISTGSMTFKGYKLCAFKTVNNFSNGTKSVEVSFFVYNKNGYTLLSSRVSDIKSYSTSSTGTMSGGYINLQTGVINTAYNNYSGQYIDFSAYWSGYDYDDSDSCAKFNTNVPIFASSDDAKAFMCGELTEKDALNYETDLCNVKYDLEIPQEMKLDRPDDFIDKLTGDSSDYTFSWKQTDKNYVHWDTQFFYYIDIYAFEGFLSFEVGDGKRFNDEFVYADKVATYKLKFVKQWENIIDSDEYDAIWARINAEYPTYTSSTIKTYKVYIRNSYFDGNIQHYSNWIYVEIDTETDNVSIVELAGNTDDTPGTSTPGKDVTGSVVEDSIYDGSIQNAASSSGDILNYVSNGFGFTGEGGIIDMISEGFSFIPGDFWTVFIAGIGIMVMIAVFKFAMG